MKQVFFTFENSKCYKSDKKITKNEKDIVAETQDFNVENPSKPKREKTTGASQQNFTISGGV
jgi:hypothetical protein